MRRVFMCFDCALYLIYYGLFAFWLFVDVVDLLVDFWLGCCWRVDLGLLCLIWLIVCYWLIVLFIGCFIVIICFVILFALCFVIYGLFRICYAVGWYLFWLLTNVVDFSIFGFWVGLFWFWLLMFWVRLVCLLVICLVVWLFTFVLV